jgi:regulator of protease activity HflC (stomatin/prohibitin superfamily)
MLRVLPTVMKHYVIQVLSDVNTAMLVPLIRKYGIEFRKPLVYDRIREELRTFCAQHTIDEVYNSKFLSIVAAVKENVEKSIERLGKDSIKILNLVIPKPVIPSDIASNYKLVRTSFLSVLSVTLNAVLITLVLFLPQVKVQWTSQLVASQQQKTEKIKKETESIKAVLDAEREKKVLKIDIEKEVLRKEGEKNLSSLQVS